MSCLTAYSFHFVILCCFKHFTIVLLFCKYIYLTYSPWRVENALKHAFWRCVSYEPLRAAMLDWDVFHWHSRVLASNGLLFSVDHRKRLKWLVWRQSMPSCRLLKLLRWFPPPSNDWLALISTSVSTGRRLTLQWLTKVNENERKMKPLKNRSWAWQKQIRRKSKKNKNAKKKTNAERLIARQTFLCGHFDSVELS